MDERARWPLLGCIQSLGRDGLYVGVVAGMDTGMQVEAGARITNGQDELSSILWLWAAIRMRWEDVWELTVIGTRNEMVQRSVVWCR